MVSIVLILVLSLINVVVSTRCDPKTCKDCICTGSNCLCKNGLTLCQGHCVNLLNDERNCGNCAVKCGKNESCVNRKCVCNKDCNRDNSNCGFCGNECPRGQKCVDGKCRCPDGHSWCKGVCVKGGCLTEICNGKDDDNDGKIDEDNVCGCTPCKFSKEVCDGIDNDCDGKIDENLESCVIAGFHPSSMCAQGKVNCVNGVDKGCEQVVFPSVEVCDGIDNDCDGLVDEGLDGKACEVHGFPKNSQCSKGLTVCHNGKNKCLQTVLPTPEICDGIDNDCDGAIDENIPQEKCTLAHLKGQCALGMKSCIKGKYECRQVNFPTKELCDGLDNDCDGLIDEDGACKCTPCKWSEEVCDGKDNDCDGLIDEDIASKDCTVAGYNSTWACAKGKTKCVGGKTICDFLTIPSAEVCDGKDNDCNGKIDDIPVEFCKVPGFDAQSSCSDGKFECVNGKKECKFLIEPLKEICDGIDNDCDGLVDEDIIFDTPHCKVLGLDLLSSCSDGYKVCRNGKIDCVLKNPLKNETCNGVDDDCNGIIDDGLVAEDCKTCQYAPGTPCSPGKTSCVRGETKCVAIELPKPEICDGVDNDCNGIIDDIEALPCKVIGYDLQSSCSDGHYACVNHARVCVLNTLPPKEICDGLDNDCDGLIDDSIEFDDPKCKVAGLFQNSTCSDGMKSCRGGVIKCDLITETKDEICNGVDDDCNGLVDDVVSKRCSVPGKLGACAIGKTKCTNGVETCEQITFESAEVCDGVDNNCDGLIDEGLDNQKCTLYELKGICADGLTKCLNGNLECQQVNFPSTELCDNLDNNCNGITDEGILPVACNIDELLGPCAAGSGRCENGTIVCHQITFECAEVCDGLDNDCDGIVDDNIPSIPCKVDGAEGLCSTGKTSCRNGTEKCQQTIFPIAEICDGLDNDCDGKVDNDVPSVACKVSGYNSNLTCSTGITVCLDGKVDCIFEVPLTDEICDGIDNDCNGIVDDIPRTPCKVPGFDLLSSCSDGYFTCVDGKKVCKFNHEPASEICDGLDNDCDGVVDDNIHFSPSKCKIEGLNQNSTCSDGTRKCVAGREVCIIDTPTSVEICDGIDNDCDGLIDDNIPSVACKSCEYEPGTPCSEGTTSCINGKVKCIAKESPKSEVCDGIDNDCNGIIDDIARTPCKVPGLDENSSCSDGFTECSKNGLTCKPKVLPCDEVCDGIDNDCDGKIDEDSEDYTADCKKRNPKAHYVDSFLCSKGECVIEKCTPGYADCDGEVKNGCEVAISFDASNCGGCGEKCSCNNGVSICVNGECQTECSFGYLDCDGKGSNGCEVNALQDEANCGECGKECLQGPNSVAKCVFGKCLSDCNDGFADCNKDSKDGCEVRLSSSASNCGSCGNDCSRLPNTLNAQCKDGKCTFDCKAGWADCDCDASNGCEVNLMEDGENCGVCNSNCKKGNNLSDAKCSRGECQITCSAGYGNCDGEVWNGCEVDLSSSTSNCGACNLNCLNLPSVASASCLRGSCQIACKPNRANCDNNSSNGCEVDLLSDLGNCGKCGVVCKNLQNVKSTTCLNGGCQIVTCADGYADCDKNVENGCEVNLNDSESHCGACGQKCSTDSCSGSADATCSSGKCIIKCKEGLSDCNENALDGCESDLLSDEKNCGKCGNECKWNEVCKDGKCSTTGCKEGWADCDKKSSNGCEINLTCDEKNCGKCDNECECGKNAKPLCKDSTCTFECEDGFANCSGRGNGCETNLRDDSNNCGKCGFKCSKFTYCKSGICIPRL